VFVQVYKSAHRYRVAAKFSTWLFTIVRNLCLNELRRRSRHPATSLEAAAEDRPEGSGPVQFQDVHAINPNDAAMESELADKIEEALGQLPENQRTAILLCRDQDMSYEDIAKVLGTSLSATKSLIHRGRETLKQSLKPYLRSGEWRTLD
jgi:RNA polymerase sigma-70 factor (ECF subfamily)